MGSGPEQSTSAPRLYYGGMIITAMNATNSIRAPCSLLDLKIAVVHVLAVVYDLEHQHVILAFEIIQCVVRIAKRKR